MKSSINPEKTDINELDKSRIICQIQKTGNTIFRIQEVEIQVEHLKLPIRQLNDLRRDAIEKFEKALENSILRKTEKPMIPNEESTKKKVYGEPKINLFLQKFDEQMDYTKLAYNEIYVPWKDVIKHPNLRDCIAILPNIIEENYERLILENTKVLDTIKGIMISHVSQIELLKTLNFTKKIVGNESLNITNRFSEKIMKELGIERFTISPELDKKAIQQFSDELEKEWIVYGRTCLMTSKYCPIGKNENCHQICQTGKYALKDRKNFVFPVVTDPTNCHARIYNSKILSGYDKTLKVDFVRIDLLNETPKEIETIMATVKAGKRLQGKDFTNGNFNRFSS